MLVLKNLSRRKARTALSLLGIAIGIAAIIAFHAIGQGFRKSLDRYMHESGAQALVLSRLMQDPAFSRVTSEDQEFVRTLPQVEHLSAGTFALASPKGLKVKTGRMPTLLVFGRTPGDRILDKFKGKVKGRIFAADDEVMLGKYTAETFALAVGDSLELFGRSFRVVGIYDSGVSFENVGAMAPNSVVQAVLKTDSINMGFLYLRPGADWGAVRDAVEARNPQLTVIRTEEFTNFYNQLEYIDWFVWIISLVSVIIGGLGVLNTMLMAVSERTREIGTLRAVGWSQPMVLRLILMEGVTISLLGGALGLGVGTIGAELLIRVAPTGFLSTHFSGALYGIAMVVAVLLGFTGAMYPAVRASQLSPIEALKYE
jgi:putative ABC transport system permease protein